MSEMGALLSALGDVERPLPRSPPGSAYARLRSMLPILRSLVGQRSH
jgi:hypothetical protein